MKYMAIFSASVGLEIDADSEAKAREKCLSKETEEEVMALFRQNGIELDELSEVPAKDDAALEQLKTALFCHGYEAVSDFLGYDYPAEEDEDTTDRRLDEALDQMPGDELKKFLDKYGILS